MNLKIYPLHDQTVTMQPLPNRRCRKNVIETLPEPPFPGMANSQGWDLRCPYAFEAIWAGGPEAEDIEIYGLDLPSDRPPFVQSQRGGGILTLHSGYQLKTESNVALWVRGPVNRPKDGLYPLDQIVDTSLLPCTITVNWKFTRPNQTIRFEAGEPFGVITPYPKPDAAATAAETVELVPEPEAYEPEPQPSRPYNLTLSHERKFIWFRIAKICTRTIYHHLKQNNIPLDIDHAYQVHYPVHLCQDYFKFAFVRNPWDRLVSCWQNKVVEGNYFRFSPETHAKMKRFENFVGFVSKQDIENGDPHLKLQSHLIDLNHIDYIGRFETFAEDFRAICQRLDIPIHRLEHRNRSDRAEDYRGYYNDALREKVYYLYRKDIQLFGYAF